MREEIRTSEQKKGKMKSEAFMKHKALVKWSAIIVSAEDKDWDLLVLDTSGALVSISKRFLNAQGPTSSTEFKY